MKEIDTYSERLAQLELNGFIKYKGCISNGKYSFLYHQIDTSEISDEEFEEFIELVKLEMQNPK